MAFETETFEILENLVQEMGITVDNRQLLKGAPIIQAILDERVKTDKNNRTNEDHQP